MKSDVARLLRWIRRARPPRAALSRALGAGLVASLTNVALLVGAVALLVESATRPGLRAVAVVLIVIELFAFLRSPLRFLERLSAHQLGYAAVTHWRQWLVRTVGQLDYSTWRHYAAGDLLERALGDTDELQDLWLRFVVPFIDTLAVMVIGDLVVAVLPPHGPWWPYAVLLLALQLLGTMALVLNARRELARDQAVRTARGRYRAQLVELSAVTPELVLLGRSSFASQRSTLVADGLERAERRSRRQRRLGDFIVALTSLLAVAAMAVHPETSPVWLVVAAVIGLSTYEELTVVRSSLAAAVEVSGGGARLESLEHTTTAGTTSWPRDAVLRCSDVSLSEDGRTLVEHATFSVLEGAHVAIIGESGVGKSTLLRALAALDHVDAGSITIGGVDLHAIDDSILREHVSYVASEPGLTRGFARDVLTLGRPTTRDSYADLAQLGVASNASSRFDELSRGERVRVALARALVSNPDIYLLDEPTAGLGRDETLRVLALLSTTAASVLIATHDDVVLEWSDVVLELRDGALHALRR